MPLPVKYSAFATKVTFRRTISGMKIESEKERWLLAMIAGPSAGTLSRPSTCGRKINLSQGPRMTYLSRWYSTSVLPGARPEWEESALSLRTARGTPQRTPGSTRRRVTIQLGGWATRDRGTLDRYP